MIGKEKFSFFFGINVIVILVISIMNWKIFNKMIVYIKIVWGFFL